MLLIADGGAAERLPIAVAIERARAQEQDLIEVAAKADPPVVKIGDVGHYMYQQQKKEKKQKAHSKQTEVKMLRFGFRTEQHDLDRLMDRAKEFFAERHLVKFAVRLRGREFTNKTYAADKLRKIITDLADCSEVEQDVKLTGNQFIAVLRPKRT